MKQVDLAKIAGISPAYVSQIVNRLRRPSWDIAKKLAETLNCPIEIFFEGSKEQIKRVIDEN